MYYCSNPTSTVMLGCSTKQAMLVVEQKWVIRRIRHQHGRGEEEYFAAKQEEAVLCCRCCYFSYESERSQVMEECWEKDASSVMTYM